MLKKKDMSTYFSNLSTYESNFDIFFCVLSLKYLYTITKKKMSNGNKK